jgi:hypothetical protein
MNFAHDRDEWLGLEMRRRPATFLPVREHRADFKPNENELSADTGL